MCVGKIGNPQLFRDLFQRPAKSDENEAELNQAGLVVATGASFNTPKNISEHACHRVWQAAHLIIEANYDTDVSVFNALINILRENPQCTEPWKQYPDLTLFTKRAKSHSLKGFPQRFTRDF